MSSGRRSFHLALPTSDPRSALILAWINALPGNTDVSAEIRRIFAEALESAEWRCQVVLQLTRIEQILESGVPDGSKVASLPTNTPVMPTLLASLTCFDDKT
jgi:hypothetical protein